MNDILSENRSRRRAVIVALIVAGVLVVGGALAYWRFGPTAATTENARLALDAGDAAQAVRLAKASLEHDPDSFDALLILSEGSIRLADYAQARKAAERAAAIRPSDPMPPVLRARAYRIEATGPLAKPFDNEGPAQAAASLRSLDQALDVIRDLADTTDPKGRVALERARIHLAASRCHQVLHADSLKLERHATISGRPDEAARCTQKAADELAACRKGQDVAMDVLERALAVPQPNVEAAGELNALYEQRGYYDRILDVYALLTQRGLADERTTIQAASALLAQAFDKTGPRRADNIARAKQLLIDHLARHPDSLDARVAMGRLALIEGNPVAARRTADALLDADPSNMRARLLKAMALIAERDFEQAKQLLQPISTYYPTWSEIQLSLAAAQIATDYASIGQQLLRQVLETDPGNMNAAFRLARSYWEVGQPELAEKELRALLAHATATERALPAIVDLMRHYSTRQRAIALVDELVSAPDATPRLLEVAAGQYWALGEPHKARDAITRAGQAPSQSPTARLIQAGRAIDVGDTALAESILTGLEADPTVGVDAVIQLATLRYRQKRPAEARNILESLLKRSDLTPSQRLAVADAYLKADDATAALAIVRGVLANDEKSYAGQTLLGQVLLATGDTAGARQAFARADRLAPADDIDPNRRASLALLRGDYEECVRICENTLNAHHEAVSLHLIAAEALERLDRIDRAAQQLAAFIRAEPDDLVGYARLVRLYQRAHKPDAGFRALGEIAEARSELVRLAQARLMWADGAESEAVARLAAVVAEEDKALPTAARREIATTLAPWQFALGRLDDALKTYAWLAQNEDLTTDAAWGRFSVLRAAGQTSEARDVLTSLAETIPPESRTAAQFQRFAEAFASLGETDAAERTIADWAVVDPDSIGPARLHMRLLREHGDANGAAAALAAALAKHPMSPELLSDGARLYMDARDFIGAESLLQRLAKTGPSAQDDSRRLRGEMLTRVGLYEAAVKELSPDDAADATLPDETRLVLARAMAGAGRPDDADRVLRGMPTYSPHYADALAALADNALRRGHVTVAADRLAEAVQQEPSDLALRVRAADVMTAARRYDGAGALIASLLRHARTPQGRSEWIGRQAELLWITGDGRGALHALDEAITGDPADARLRVRFAALALADGRDADATRVVKECQPPDSDPTLAAMAAALQSLAGLTTAGDAATTRPANGATTRPAATEPQNEAIWVPAVALAAAGDTTAATKALAAKSFYDWPPGVWNRAVSTAAGDESMRRLLRGIVVTRALRATGLRHAAIRLARRIAEQNPDAAPAWRNLLDVLPDDATFAAERGRVVDLLRNRQADTLLGQEQALDAMCREHRLDEARKLLANIEAAEPASAWLYAERGAIEEAGLQWSAAAEAYARAAELDPNGVAVLNNEAYALAQSADGSTEALAKARAIAQRAEALAPTAPAIQETLGWIDVLEGRPSDGLRRLQSCLVALANQPMVHYHVGIAYEKAGQPAFARMHLEQAARSIPETLPERSLAAERVAALTTRPAGNADTN